MVSLGIMFRCARPPDQLGPFAQAVERYGYDELWVVEDCFWAGGIASSAHALAVTERIAVGLGIVPAVARNPAFTAMEFAALARLHPSRFLPGIGHGVGDWMQQIGAFPSSQLAALEEVAVAVRGLLRGESVTMHGRHVDLKAVKLEYPPDVVPPVQLGVRSIKSLQLAGRSADGTLLAEGAAPDYVRWARQQIAAGQAQAKRTEPHRVTVYVWARVETRREEAWSVVRPVVARTVPYITSQLEPAGLAQSVATELGRHGVDGLSVAMPPHWLEALTVSGTPEDCAASIERFVEAGADSVVLVPVGEDDDEQAQRLAAEVLPLVRGRAN